jgi:hypothetical protein
MVIDEGILSFEFQERFKAMKFDDSNYYRHHFARLPDSKAIDVLAASDDEIVMMEIKDFTGHERENANRMKVNFSSEDGKESLDREFSKKIRDSLACILSSAIKKTDNDVSPYYNSFANYINKSGMKIYLILFIEGNYPDFAARATVIRDSIKKKLKSLDVRISIENLQESERSGFYTATRN